MGLEDINENIRLSMQGEILPFMGLGEIDKVKRHFEDMWAAGAKGKATIAANAGMGVGAAGLGLAYIATKEAVEVEESSKRVQAVYQVNQKAMGAYGQFIESHSSTLLQSQKSLYEGLGQIMAQFGGNVNQKFADQILTGASKVATVFNTTLPDAIKPASIALKDFHEGVTKTFDTMSKAASMTQGGWKALFGSGPTQKVMGLAAQHGVSLQDLMGADVTLAKQTGGGRAMSALGTLIEHIGGLQGGDASLQGNGLVGTVRGLLARYANDPKALSKAFGGSSGITYANMLTGAGANTQAVGQSSGYLNTSFGTISKDTTEQFKQMQLAIQADEVAIGRGLIPILNQVVSTLQPVLKGASEWITHNSELAGTFIKVALGIGGASVGLRLFIALLSPFKTAIDVAHGALDRLRAMAGTSGAATDKLANQNLPNLNRQVQTSGSTVDRFGTNNLGTLNKNVAISGATVDNFGNAHLGTLNKNIGISGAAVDTFGKTNLGNLDRQIATSGTTVDGFSTTHMARFDASMVAAGAEADVASAQIGSKGVGLVGAIGGLAAAAMEITAAVLAWQAAQQVGNVVAGWVNGVTGGSVSAAKGFYDNLPDWVRSAINNNPGLGLLPGAIDSVPGSSNSSSGNSAAFSSKGSIFQAVGGSSYFTPRGSQFGFSGAVSSDIVNNNDAQMLSAYGIGTSGSIRDTDIPGGVSPVMLPGGKGQTYRLVKQWMNGDYGGVEVWQAPNGGIITLMHLSTLTNTTTAVGGTTVGMSGAPLTNAYGNTKGSYHLCIITDAKGRSFLAYLNDNQVKTTPGAVALDSSTTNSSGGTVPASTYTAPSFSAPSVALPTVSMPSGPVDHTGQPGWIMGADGKWHSVPKPGNGKYTWTGTGWMLSATFTAIAQNQDWQKNESLQQHGLEWAYPSGMNLSKMPAGMNINQWLTAQYKINELKRQEWDQTARIAYLRGQINKSELDAIMAQDNQAKDFANQAARAKAHAVGGGSGSAGVARVRIVDQCAEQAKANKIHQATADAAKAGADAAKGSEDILSHVHNTLVHIAALLKSMGSGHGLGEGANPHLTGWGMVPSHGG